MKISFTPIAYDEFTRWISLDKAKIKKISKLLKSIEREGPMKGEGKPERLKYIDGYSRHIDDGNRLVYQYQQNEITVLSCSGHYQD